MATPIEFHHSFIENLKTLGGWLYNDKQEQLLYHRLGKHTTEQLVAAATSLALEKKQKPSIAEIVSEFPKPVTGIANITIKQDDPYGPYPMKFIKEVVQPAMKEYADGLGMDSWRIAFDASTKEWEENNYPLTEHFYTSEDYKFSEFYFAFIMKNMMGELARKSYTPSGSNIRYRQEAKNK